MFKLLKVIALTLVLLSAQAYAANKLFEGQKVDAVKAYIIDIFSSQNFSVDQDSPSRLVISKEISGGSGFAIGFLQTLTNTQNNSASGENPRSEYNFTFIQKPEGVTVIAGSALLTPLSNGNVQRQRIDDDELPKILDALSQKMSSSKVEQSKIEKLAFGVSFVELPQTLAVQMGMPNLKGVVITIIQPDSVAERAGIKVGDILSQFNGKPILTTQDLQGFVLATQPKTDVLLVGTRALKPIKLTAHF